jgi:hypothetical protein
LALLEHSNAKDDATEHAGHGQGGNNDDADHPELFGNRAGPKTGRQQFQVDQQA